MRIDRLDLIAFGPFTGRKLDLSPGSEGLHLIYGDNEAGKSSCLRALVSWLFGIAVRTGDNFIHANPKLRIGGRLSLSDGEAVEFVRRKGSKDTLLDPETEEPQPDSLLARFLPGMDEDLFLRLHGIDYDGLVRGGREILDQSGDLGQALFSAAAGAVRLRGILDDLEEEAGRLFKPRASTRIVNQAAALYHQARRQIRETSLPVAEWKRLKAELAATREGIEQVEEKIVELTREKSRVERLKRVQGTLAERRELQSRLKELGEVLLLPEEFEEACRTAKKIRRGAEDLLRKVAARLERRKKDVADLRLQPELLVNEETISSLYKDLGAVEKAIEDRPVHDGKRRQLRREAALLLKGIRPDLDLDAVDVLRPLLSNGRWIESLIRQHDLLVQKRDQAAEAQKELEDQNRTLQRDRNALAGSGIDWSDLGARVAATRRAGDLDERCAVARKGAKSGQAACERELERLGRFSGTVDELSTPALPVSETLDLFERRFDEIDERLRDLQRRAGEIDQERTQAEQELRLLLSSGDVPSVAELKQARDVRDAGWRLVRRKYIDGEAVDREVVEYARGGDLPGVFERSMTETDHVSDRLRLSADQVQKRILLENRIEDLDRRAASLSEENGADREKRDRCEDEWADVWMPIRVMPGSPREMKQWMVRVEELLSRTASAREVAVEADRLEAERRDHMEALAGMLAGFDLSIETDPSTLEEMLSLCEQQIETERNAAARKEQLEDAIESLDVRLERARQNSEDAADEWERWKKAWIRAVSGFGVDSEVQPERAAGTMEQLAELFGKLDASEDLRRRIFGIDEVIRLFEENVAAFAARIGFDCADGEALAVAGRIHRELGRAREARASLDKLEAQIREFEEDAEDTRLTIRSADERLAELRQTARVAADDELEQAGELSRTRRTLQQQLERVEEELARQGDGLGVEELEREAGERDSDLSDVELERLGGELTDLHTRRDQLRDQQTDLNGKLKAGDGSAAAAEAAEEAERQLSAVVKGTEQYLRLQIALRLLEQKVELYRRENQAPVLRRAGELFHRMTLGSFARLRDDLDETGKPALYGVRPDNDLVSVAGMSDGTRDQLYLSLRLATLEQHLRKGEPYPLVVDDILIGFDDDRARAGLEMLAELARQTQVLLFTHHRRIVELAEGIESEGGVFIHELDAGEAVATEVR